LEFLANGGKLISKNMKNKNLFILTIICIISLAIISYKQLRGFNSPLSENQIPNFEMPDFESLLFEGKEGSERFVSPNKKLEMNYPSSWMRMEGGSLEYFNQEVIKEEAKVLFFAQKLDVKTGSFASLVVQELNLDKNKTVEELVQEIEKEALEKGVRMEITNLEIEGQGGLLEAKYITGQDFDLHSKEKITILELENAEPIAYLISFIALDKDWTKFEQEADEIFNSVEIKQ